MTRALSRAVGAATGSTLALALLVFGCVFAAVAGPAVSLHTRSEALQQTLGGLGVTTKTVQATANLADFGGGLGQLGGSYSLTSGQLAASVAEMGRGLTGLGLRLGTGQWAGLSTKLYIVSGAGPRV